MNNDISNQPQLNIEYGQEFFKSAVDYCEIVDMKILSLDNIKSYMAILSKLAYLVNKLEDVEPSSETIEFNIVRPSVSIRIEDNYWMLFDSQKYEELVSGSLSDDLSDIYVELKIGINLWDVKKNNDAIWFWKSSYISHWGRHLYNCLVALYDIQSN